MDLNTNWESPEIQFLNQWHQVVKEDFEIVESTYNNHTSGAADKHASSAIVNDTAVTGASVKDAINWLQTYINNLSIAGTTHDPLVMAALIDAEGDDFGPSGKGTYLDGRLRKWELRALTSKQLNVRDFGAVGDWNGTTGTDDTQAFIDCFSAASAAGGAYIIAEGKFKVTQSLTLPIHCALDGRHKRTSELCFVGENIGLIFGSNDFMSNCYTRRITISNKVVNTQITNNSIGIHMSTSHVNNIEDVLITGFYQSIYGNIAQLNKINNVYAIGCKRGIEFENVSYFNLIENSTVTGVDYGVIAGLDSDIEMRNTDIEAINNVGVLVIGNINMSVIHIESGNPAILLDGNGANCVGENIKITFPSSDPEDPVYDGIKQSTNCTNGSFYFKNIKFAGVSGYEFNCPTLSNFIIENAEYKTATGGAKEPNIILPEKGILLNKLYDASGYRYNLERGIFSVKGNDAVYKKHETIRKQIDFGTIAAQSTVEFAIITTSLEKPFNVDFYKEKVEKSFINTIPPAGVIVETWITSNTTNSITVRATNIKPAPVTVGILELGFTITNL